MNELASAVRVRVVPMLGKQGLIDKEPQLWPEDFEPPALDRCWQVAAGRGRFERLDGHGRSKQPFDIGASLPRSKRKKVATVDGFGMEAGGVMSVLNRQLRERLLSTCLRPAVAQERLSVLRDGNIAYRTQYGRGAKTHRVMTPMECMARLAALLRAGPRDAIARARALE